MMCDVRILEAVENFVAVDSAGDELYLRGVRCVLKGALKVAVKVMEALLKN